MIARGYTLDLYCEYDQDFNAHGGIRFPHQFCGETWSETSKEARRRGWRISADKSKALCPSCAKARRPFPS